MEKSREHWRYRIWFIAAAVGSAVGLGNVWKFPYITGENGGSAFILVYLFFIVVVGLSGVIGELALGRAAQLNPVGTYYQLSDRKGFWYLAGILGVITGFVILSYYSVVAGWAIAYIFKSVKDFYDFSEAAGATQVFTDFKTNPLAPLVFHGIFMFLCASIVVSGVQSGLEKWNKILMPSLLIILLVLLLRSLTLPGAGRGVEFLFQPDFSKISFKAVLIALGHACFTLSLGMGAMITYGSYLNSRENIVSAGIVIAACDTVIALLAGLVIFPAVFATGGEPGVGPSLIFEILPVVFYHMPLGIFFGCCFFIFLFIAALTSGISILEVVAAYFIDEKGWSRRKSVILMTGIIFLLGIPSSLSFGILENLKLFNLNFFDLMDHFAANYGLPLGIVLMSIFINWHWGVRNFIKELNVRSPKKILVVGLKVLFGFLLPGLVLVVIICQLFS